MLNGSSDYNKFGFDSKPTRAILLKKQTKKFQSDSNILASREAG